MEKRDLYDKNRNLTGETICKGEPIPKGKYIIVVLIMIQNSKGEFLVQKRSKEKGGKFGFTGGHAKSGESGLQGAISEVKEEIGLDLKPEELKLIFTEREDEVDVFYDLFYVKKDFDISSLTLQKEEVESANWFTVEEIEKMINNNEFFGHHSEELYRTLNILNTNKEKN